MEIKNEIDIRVQVMERLALMERNLVWLSKKTGIPHSTLYSTFKQLVYTPSEANMAKINKVFEDYPVPA